jgi:hypothetical protein
MDCAGSIALPCNAGRFGLESPAVSDKTHFFRICHGIKLDTPHYKNVDSGVHPAGYHHDDLAA